MVIQTSSAEQGGRPHPAKGVHRGVAGGEDEQGRTAHTQHGGGNGGPALRVVGEDHRQCQQQRPSRGEAEEHQPVDDGFGAARRHDYTGGGRAEPHEQARSDDRPHRPPGAPPQGVGWRPGSAGWLGRGIVVVGGRFRWRYNGVLNAVVQ